MKINTILTALIFPIFLAGCEETKSVEWWTEHHEDALKKEVECKKTGSDSQNCHNVKQANFEYQQLHSKRPDDAGMLDKYLKE
ncbi:EexN family lipoprotein [Citrobacter freundii]|nr:EexN family lipoprotein [Citrobacter freundii]